MEPIVEVAEENPLRRKSVFKEILDDEVDERVASISTRPGGRPVQRVRFRSRAEVLNPEEDDDWEDVDEDDFVNLTTTVVVDPVPTVIRATMSSKIYKIGALAFLLLLVLPLVQDLPFIQNANPTAFGVNGGVIRDTPNLEEPVVIEALLEKRQDPANVCTRFSQQSKTSALNFIAWYHGFNSMQLRSLTVHFTYTAAGIQQKIQQEIQQMLTR